MFWRQEGLTLHSVHGVLANLLDCRLFSSRVSFSGH